MKNKRLFPLLSNHAFIELTKRRELLQKAVEELERMGKRNLVLLDIGSGENPYGPLFSPIVGRYVSLDIQIRKNNVIGLAENLPFSDNSIDLILCIGVLMYSKYPRKIVNEIIRVLKPDGRAFISFAGIFPDTSYNNNLTDKWRFLYGGVKELLQGFCDYKILTEGGVIASFFSTINLFILVFTGRWWGRPFRWLLAHTIFPLNNILGIALDKLSKSEGFIANWLAICKK